MRNRNVLALGLSGALLLSGLSGCENGEGEPQPTTTAPTTAAQPVAVRNVLDRPLEMSSDPHFYTSELRTGSIEVGAPALALCIVPPNENSPTSGSVFVRNQADSEGYVNFNTGWMPRAPEVPVVPQIEPGFDVLQGQVPEC